MKITNKTGLPEAYEIAYRQMQGQYSSGLGDSDTTITTLIKPPRMVALEKEHWGEVEADIEDCMDALLGSALHHILELGAVGMIREHRWFADVAGWKVSGQADLLDGKYLSDHKLTKYYKIKDGLPIEWEQQMNGMKYLAHQNGVEIEDMQINVILKDWSYQQAQHVPGYPPKAVFAMPVPMWDDWTAKNWLTSRVNKHRLAQSGQLPLCSDDDRWYRGECWAVMKKGGKKAIRGGLKTTAKEAEDLASEKGKDHYVEHRKGENIRCQRFCHVAKFCQQWKEMQL